jgi:hypothetical protein
MNKIEINEDTLKAIKQLLEKVESTKKKSAPSSPIAKEERRQYRKISYPVGSEEHKEEILKRARSRYYEKIKTTPPEVVEELEVKKNKEKVLLDYFQTPPIPKDKIELSVPKNLVSIFGDKIELPSNTNDWSVIYRKKKWAELSKPKKDFIRKITEEEPDLICYRNTAFERIKLVVAKDKNEWKKYAKALLDHFLYKFRYNIYENGKEFYINGRFYRRSLEDMLILQTFVSYCKNIEKKQL